MVSVKLVKLKNIHRINAKVVTKIIVALGDQTG